MSFRSFLVSLIALVVLAGPVGANLVLNPGFETGDFTGWSVTGDGVLIDNVFPNTGLYDAAFSALTTDSDPGVLSQVLTTSPGLSYTISFALLDEAGFSGDSFIVQFGGYTTTVTGDTAAPPGDSPSLYTAFSFTAPSADIVGSNTTLSFEGLQDPSTNQAWNLDDIFVIGSASVVPEPATWALLLIAFVGLGVQRSLRTGVHRFAPCVRDRPTRSTRATDHH
jgi:hypothetical protein